MTAPAATVITVHYRLDPAGDDTGRAARLAERGDRILAQLAIVGATNPHVSATGDRVTVTATVPGAVAQAALRGLETVYAAVYAAAGPDDGLTDARVAWVSAEQVDEPAAAPVESAAAVTATA